MSTFSQVQMPPVFFGSPVTAGTTKAVSQVGANSAASASIAAQLAQAQMQAATAREQIAAQKAITSERLAARKSEVDKQLAASQSQFDQSFALAQKTQSRNAANQDRTFAQTQQRDDRQVQIENNNIAAAIQMREIDAIDSQIKNLKEAPSTPEELTAIKNKRKELFAQQNKLRSELSAAGLASMLAAQGVKIDAKSFIQKAKDLEKANNGSFNLFMKATVTGVKELLTSSSLLKDSVVPLGVGTNLENLPLAGKRRFDSQFIILDDARKKGKEIQIPTESLTRIANNAGILGTDKQRSNFSLLANALYNGVIPDAAQFQNASEPQIISGLYALTTKGMSDPQKAALNATFHNFNDSLSSSALNLQEGLSSKQKKNLSFLPRLGSASETRLLRLENTSPSGSIVKEDTLVNPLYVQIAQNLGNLAAKGALDTASGATNETLAKVTLAQKSISDLGAKIQNLPTALQEPLQNLLGDLETSSTAFKNLDELTKADLPIINSTLDKVKTFITEQANAKANTPESLALKEKRAKILSRQPALQPIK